MAKTFVSANGTRLDALDTAFGNWEYTQPWSISVWHKPSGNLSGALVSKREGSGNFRGWEVFARAGTTLTQYAGEVCNIVGSNRVSMRTTNEFSTATPHHVVVTYDGSGAGAGFHIYVDNVDQALTTTADTLAASTIVNAVNAQIGARGGSGAPANLLSGDLSRVLINNVVLTAAEVAILFGATSPAAIVTRGLQAWIELSDLGATVQPDWSGNGKVFAINFAQTYLAGPKPDLVPATGFSGALSLSGPLVRNASNPILENLGWVGGANNGTGDQIGPGVIIKAGAGDYRAWFENNTGSKSLDVGNQTGGFDWDVPTIYGTSPTGNDDWTLSNQDVPASALITCNNLTTNPAGNETAFKAAVKGETSISSLFYDPDDGIYKAWMHGGNNSGTRQIYYLKCTGGTGDPAVAGNWVVQNSGNPVVAIGSAGADDETWLADAHVVRVSSSLMVMLYLGVNSSGVKQILHASSTDRGLTWTKNGRAIAPTAGAWDAVIVGSSFAYDERTGLYVCWYGGQIASGASADGIGFAYTSNPSSIPFTKGTFNPVFCRKDITTGTNTLEYVIANTLHSYLDNTSYRHLIKADNGVSGTTGFRGRIEATNLTDPRLFGGLLLALSSLLPAPAGNATVTPATATLTLATFSPALALAVIPGNATLTVTSFAPTIALAVIPATASLVTTAFAPVLAEATIPGTRALTISTFAPQANLAVIPSTASLTLSTFAPTVIATANVTVTPGIATLTTTSYAPVLALAVIPSTSALVTTTFAPVLNLSVIPGTLALTTTKFAPVLALAVIPSTLSLTLSTFAPTIVTTTNYVGVPSTASLVITAFAPTVLTGGNVSVTPGIATLTTSAFAPVLAVSVIPGPASLTVSGFAPALRESLTPGTTALITTTFAPTVTVLSPNTVVNPGVANLLLTTYQPTIFNDRYLRSRLVWRKGMRGKRRIWK